MTKRERWGERTAGEREREREVVVEVREKS